MLIHCLQDAPPGGLNSSPGLLRAFTLPCSLIPPGKVQILAEPPVSEVALDEASPTLEDQIRSNPLVAAKSTKEQVKSDVTFEKSLVLKPQFPRKGRDEGF